MPPREISDAVRIYTLAKELKLDSKVLVDLLAQAGITVKGSALASLTEDELAVFRAFMAKGGGAAAKPAAPAAPKISTGPAPLSGPLRREDSLPPVGKLGGKPPPLAPKAPPVLKTPKPTPPPVEPAPEPAPEPEPVVAEPAALRRLPPRQLRRPGQSKLARAARTSRSRSADDHASAADEQADAAQEPRRESRPAWSHDPRRAVADRRATRADSESRRARAAKARYQAADGRDSRQSCRSLALRRFRHRSRSIKISRRAMAPAQPLHPPVAW